VHMGVEVTYEYRDCRDSLGELTPRFTWSKWDRLLVMFPITS
jgi:hypothetical protein